MKIGFYFGLAKDGIRKNKQLYLPYILTCIGMVMMYYIIVFLQYNPLIASIHGGQNAQMCLGFGNYIIAFFSCIFLFYTNSFLIRRRKKEFGLYNILGMGRKHLGYILFWETLIIAALSIVIGLFAGILFSKVAELGMINLLKLSASLDFYISKKAICCSIGVFSIIFVLLYLNNLRQIRFQTTLALLGSEKVGEKPPKANWFFGILGFVILVIAYYTSVTIKNPMAAITLFFWAVLLVIVGTYLIMIAGSVLLCKVLQKNKKYYYNKKHFVSVSSMVYRMKRNGAGLASICILSTMVLVMISSTSCLYFGSEDSLKSHYPREMMLNVYSENADGISDEKKDNIFSFSKDYASIKNVSVKNEYYFRSASLAALLVGDRFEMDVEQYGDRYLGELDNLVMIYFVPVSDLCEFSGKDYSVQPGEAYLITPNEKYQFDTIKIGEQFSVQVKENIKEDYLGIADTKDVVDSIYLFVPDLDKSLKLLQSLKDYTGLNVLRYSMTFGFDTGLDQEQQISFSKNYQKALAKENFIFEQYSVSAREENRADFFTTFGGLLYLGIILSIVFILAAALIIYYKQISEGYEDRARFHIMQKVGMTRKEIRKSIDSQILTVFFFPLILSGVHVCFAFPVIEKLLVLFGLFNSKLFVITSIVSFVLFAFLYIIVYRMTSNVYFHIVSNRVA